jgi:tetratricopeptide (TPR) repeat protein
MSGGPVIIDDKARFSQAKIWHAQREYYDKQGIDAWSGDVPFYITSNAYIGGTYATLVIRFIQDWLRREPEAINETFYVIELGTGSGQFSYYFLRQFERLRDSLNLNDVKFCYVMSDFTQANVDFWNSHKGLESFVEKGMLDYAVFDIEHDTQVSLVKSNTVISPKSLKNPLTVFANYLFDSVVSDVFNVEKHKLHESLVSMHTKQHNVKDGNPISWENVKVNYTDVPVKGAYYDDEHFDKVLHSYEKDLESGAFFYPIGSLRVIRQLLKMSNNKMLLLTSDKGHIDLEELEEESHPELDFHGSFSVMVNYDAIGRYFDTLGGDYYMQCPRDAIVTAAFLLGSDISELTEFQFALDQHVSEFSPADYFNIYENIEDKPEEYSIDTLASALSLSRWDPGMWSDISERVSDCIEDADHDLIEYLKKYLHRVAENYYHMPGSEDIIFEVGTFFQEISECETALHYYALSRQYFPSTWEYEFNCGFCYVELEEYDKAQGYLERALEHDPKSSETRGLMKKVERELAKVD